MRAGPALGHLASMLVCASAVAVAQAQPRVVTDEVDPAHFSAAPEADVPKPWGVRVIAGPEWQPSRNLADGVAWRSAIDLRQEFALGADWRGVLSNRLESTHGPHGVHHSTHALREAYVTRAANAHWFVDIGRVNVRSGVGLGYNPTDWLRGSVLATPANQNPASARENRLGAFMLRMQHVTDSGSMHFAYAPQLTSDAAAPMRSWGLNVARGNAGHAFQWRWAPRVTETLSLDVMALARTGQPFEVGANLSAVITPSVVAHAEVSVARRPRPGPEGGPIHKGFAPRAALGLSWTLPTGATLGVEYQHAADALSGADWDRLRRREDPAALRAIGAWRSERARTQDPLLRSGWFARFQWNDVLRDGRYDLGAFVRLNPHDKSRLWQISGAWHVTPAFSLRLITFGVQGGLNTEYGGRALQHYVWIGGEIFF